MTDHLVHPDDRDDVHELVEAARGGDRQAFAQLFDRFHPRVYRAARGQLAHDADAEEVAVDVFVAVWRKLDDYRWTGAPFAAWVFRIAQFEIARVLRSRRRREQVVVEGAGNPDLDPHLDLDRHNALVVAMRSLGERERSVIALRFYAGLAAPEVALVLGTSAANVRQIQLRALRQLGSDASLKEAA